MKKLRQIIWAFRYRRAVRKANRLSALFGMTYMVIYMGGRLKVVPRRTLKQLVRTGRFRKGTTMEDIDKRALYTTN